MASEIAINVPFDSGEIVEIAKQELEKRMRSLSPLQGSKEYAAFSIEYQVKVTLLRAGEQKHEARETLAWGNVAKGMPTGADLDAVDAELEVAEATGKVESRDPNEERQERNMPMTVETNDGKGGRVRRKIKVKR